MLIPFVYFDFNVWTLLQSINTCQGSFYSIHVSHVHTINRCRPQRAHIHHQCNWYLRSSVKHLFFSYFYLNIFNFRLSIWKISFNASATKNKWNHLSIDDGRSASMTQVIVDKCKLQYRNLVRWWEARPMRARTGRYSSMKVFFFNIFILPYDTAWVVLCYSRANRTR